MKTLNRLLDAAQKACDPPTVMALKERLGVSRQTIYDWRNGSTTITDDHLARLVELATATPADAIAVRRESAKSDHERALWRSVAKQLGAAAALALAVALPQISKANEADCGTLTEAQSRHYAKWNRYRFRVWGRLIRATVRILLARNMPRHEQTPLLA